MKEDQEYLNPNQQPYYGQQQPGYPPYPPQGAGGAMPQPGFQQPGFGGYPQPGYPQPGYPQPGFGGVPGAVPFPHMPPQQDMYGGGGYTGDDSAKGFEFNDESVRKAFIRKVYSILMCQLLLTFGFICLFKFHEPTKYWAMRNSWLFWVALAVLFITMLSMACCESVRRTSPTNFIFLGLFTFAQGFMLGVTTIAFSADEIMLAVGLTAVICFALTLFAFQTKWDFTVMGGVLFVAVILLMVLGIVGMFWPGKTLQLIYGALGALVFSIYLIYDTQLMMGGKHKYSISPEEYIFASLNLYLDIINILMYILTIISASRD